MSDNKIIVETSKEINMIKQTPTGEILVCQNDDGSLKLGMHLQDETAWLNQAQLVRLYASSKANISGHIKIFFQPVARLRLFA